MSNSVLVSVDDGIGTVTAADVTIDLDIAVGSVLVDNDAAPTVQTATVSQSSTATVDGVIATATGSCFHNYRVPNYIIS